jgi:cytochrome c-type protein NapC
MKRIFKLLGIGAVALIAAGALIGVGAAGLKYSSSEQFCISCHEMNTHAYAEFKDTIHDTNRSGVRATCSDCHVPREPLGMMERKIAALREVYGHFTGVIDTKEKYEAHRYEMARRVWVHMKETDSRECRNCHNDAAMSAELQSEKAQSRHAKGKAEGLTCIDCHSGIAHTEPEGPGPRELKVSRK